jgi:hypothetical protein
VAAVFGHGQSADGAEEGRLAAREGGVGDGREGQKEDRDERGDTPPRLVASSGVLLAA